MAELPEPFWYPNISFSKYHKHPKWAERVKEVQTCLDCEPWQAWLILTQLVQVNTMAAAVIVEREENREPWENEDDEDE